MTDSTRISRSFKDISLSFQPHPVTNDIPVLKNENAIKRSVRNIVETIPGEKFFNPDFGSQVYGLLFENADLTDAVRIEQQIISSLESYEPRVDNVKVRVNPAVDRNEFDVTVTYDIVGQEFPRQEYTFILEATR